jgi:hypothetical protein
MQRVLFSTAASLAAMAFVVAPATAATEIVLEGNPVNDTLSGNFGANVIGPGMFTSEFFFDVPEEGAVSSTVSTIIVRGFADIDFTSVMLNGTPFTLTNGADGSEFGTISNLFVNAGRQDLVVSGMVADGVGSFGGTISFVPETMGAVPEPGTWALMLLGFAAVGFSLRRRKPEARETRVRYNFA